MRRSRIALYACSYNEIDGVANTIRNLEGYAAGNGQKLLLIHGGSGNRDCMNKSVR